MIGPQVTVQDILTIWFYGMVIYFLCFKELSIVECAFILFFYHPSQKKLGKKKQKILESAAFSPCLNHFRDPTNQC